MSTNNTDNGNDFGTGIDEGSNSAKQVALVYADAIKVDGIYDDNEEATMELEKSSRGKLSWNPNVDPERPLETKVGKVSPSILRFGRNSANNKEGLFLAPGQLSDFGIGIKGTKHGTQLNVVLIDGRVLIGYFVNTEKRKGAYFPFRYLPTNLKLPSVGTKLPVKVDKIIIG